MLDPTINLPSNPSWTPSVLPGGQPATESSVPAESPFVDTAGETAGATAAPVAAPTDYTSASAVAAEAATQAPVDTSFGHLWMQQAHDDYRHLSNILTSYGMTPDASYRLPQYNTPQWAALTAGIPEQYWSAFGNAVSADHAGSIRQNILADIHSAQEMSQAGTLKRLAMGITDPESLAQHEIPGVGD